MKKLFLTAAALASLLCLTLALAGCDFGSGGSTHEHEYTETVVAPTCTEQGYTLYTCSCGDSYTDNYTEALGHSWNDGEVTQAATCTTTGEAIYTCTVCQETQTGTIPALGHSWNDGEVTQAATCTMAGEMRYTCTVCQTTKTETVRALGHSFTEYVSDENATCTANGTKTAVCDRDGCSVTNTIMDEGSALGHSFTEYVSDKNATCTEDGTKTAVCDRDGCSVTDTVTDEGSALGHDYISHAAQAATCTQIGWEAYYTCSRCDYSTYVEIAALGHDYVSHEAQAATCTEIGWEAYYTCSRCNYSTYEEIAALGHDYVSHEAQAPTCTEFGWEAYDTCSRCDYSTYKEIVALGHNYISHAAQAATCTEIGWEAYYTCSRCDYSTYVEFPATGHTVGEAVRENVIEATCTEDGSYNSVIYCSVCHAELSRETVIVDALGHKWEWEEQTEETHTGECTVCGEVLTEAAHEWEDNVCTVCGYDAGGSKGLEWALQTEGDVQYYAVSGIGSCTGAEIVIPSVYNGVAVTEIAERAFRNVTAITAITIPDSVTSIGDYAFYNCTGLTEINYNATECAGLSRYNYVFYKAGQSGEGITVYIGANVKSIPARLFCPYDYSSSYAPKIVRVEFAEGSKCKSIGDHAFAYCTSLTEITIPNSVTSIGDEAFWGCNSLMSITIPDSVTSIGDYAFYNCTGLTEINYNATECADLSKYNYVFYKAGQSGEGITVYIGANVKSIPAYLFSLDNSSSASKFVSVEFAAGSICESIGDSAFYKCTSLTSITIPDGVKTIGDSAFYKCTSLTSITIPDGVTSIGDWAFRDCTGLTKIYYNATECADLSSSNMVFSYAEQSGEGITVYIGANVKSIPAYLFYNYNSSYITNVVFAEGSECTSIGGSAFAYCTSLTSITIPDSVKTIGDHAFYNCTGLTSITIPDGVTSIGSRAFEGCSKLTYTEYENAYYLGNDSNPYVVLVKAISTSITSCTIHEDTKIIYYEAFCNCRWMNSITIPNDVIYIGEEAFRYCTGSITVESGNTVYHSEGNCLIETASKTLIAGHNNSVIPSDGSVTSIGSYAFYNCRNLTGITIPDSVTSIGKYAFYECTSLTSITIPDGVTSIGRYAFSGCTGLTSVTIGSGVTSIGSSAFYGCSGLESITVESGNTVYHSAGNCLIETESKTLILGCKNSVIPTDGSVTSIGSYAFYHCTSLTEITIPDSLTSIGYRAFYNCTSLTSVTIGSGVTSIGNYAFYNCTAEIVWGENPIITEIGSYAFAYYAGTSITIPDSVTSIGSSAFSGCTSLMEIYYNATECADLSYNDYIISSAGQSGYAGQSGEGITVYIGANVKSIPAYLFRGSNIVSVVFAEGSICTSIGNDAFFGCTGLTAVYYGGSAEDWSSITIGSANGYLTNATRYYYSESDPTEEGNYWHYVDGEVKIWGDDSED